MSIQLEILLLDEQSSYLPGCWLEGFVQLCVTEPQTARSLTLALRGAERVSLAAGGEESSEEHSIFECTLTLWGFLCGVKRVAALPAGRHLFPFRMQLPVGREVPASGASSFGSVSYALSAQLQLCSEQQPNFAAAHLPLTVRALAPLCAPQLQPVSVCVERQMRTFGVLRAGRIQVRAAIERRGFVCGENLRVALAVTNMSAVAVTGFQVKFLRHTSFKANALHRAATVTLQTLELPFRIAASSGRVDTTLSVPVPPGPLPASFDGKLIKLKYALAIRTRVAGALREDIELYVPLVACTSAEAETAAPPESLFSASGDAHRAVLLPTSGGDLFPAVCLDVFKYNAADQTNHSAPVQYPCFSSGDGTLPETLEQLGPRVLERVAAHPRVDLHQLSPAPAKTPTRKIPPPLPV